VRQQVADFMQKNSLIDNNKIKMLRHERLKFLGKFTLARKKVFSNGITKIYFLGIPILKISN
ncbi:MAG TPA: hypothetical protein PLZ05_01835, partial [Alphaproteobacteria bacterium]|nr:hypothetical protein [Alphaproteobacteria bacterium]